MAQICRVLVTIGFCSWQAMLGRLEFVALRVLARGTDDALLAREYM